MTSTQIIAIVIFLVTMAAIMTEKLHRTVAAVAGALLLILTGVLSVESGFSYVDLNTLGVLIGMMLFVAVVKNSGIFEYIAIKAAKIAKGRPWPLMVLFALITAVLSAFLDNVTTVLLIGPMTLAITSMLRINPIPFFMTQIMASNIGGTATLIGDPPNIMIGSAAGLSFTDFITNTGVAVLVVLAATIVCFYFIYGRKLHVEPEAMDSILQLDENKAIKDRSLLIKSVVMILLVVFGFVFHSQLHLESCTIALTAAAVMLLIGRQDVEEIVAGVDWTTILFFTGLFIVVGGLQETGVIQILANGLMDLTEGHMTLTILLILWVSAIVSSFLDNIPFVATLIPLILTMQSSGVDVTPLWWAVSLGACLGGNGTLIGASANVVLSGISNRHGFPITFASYFKVGFPLMLVSVAISTVFLLLRFT
ncbi:SLC13 family permease [Evtepia gabavorous]|uniref:SLC13 family permease n=1 Tax=Evtepia gabavorous TaxID=2211183 RepID=UPI003AADFCAA